MLVQRLGSDMQYDPEYIEQYIRFILDNSGSCDEVWLATDYGFPPLQIHQEHSEKLRDIAKQFRNNGIKVSLQLSNSIGHGQYMARRDCTGLVYPGSPARRLVGHDGTIAEYCFCWNDAVFKNYLLKEIELYISEIQPEWLWIDDDFRITNHAPVKMGCFCDACIASFNQKHGYTLTREELVEGIESGNKSYLQQFSAFEKKSLQDLMKDICKTVVKNSSVTKVGLQNAANGGFLGRGLGFLFETIVETTCRETAYRAGAGCYNDHNPNDIFDKSANLSWQKAMLPDFVRHRYTEIENTPFVAYGKSAAGTALETAHYYASGQTDMSYSMIMRTAEPMAWHEEEFRLLSQMRPYFDRLARMNHYTYSSGIKYVVSQDPLGIDSNVRMDILEINREYSSKANYLIRDAIPIVYDQENEIAILHPLNASRITKNEFEELKSKPVITDGESIRILQQRGFDLGVTSVEIDKDRLHYLHEKIHNLECNAGMKTFVQAGFAPGKENSHYFSRLPVNSIILGVYDTQTILEPFLVDNENPYGVATAIIPTDRNAKWALFGYSLWKGVIPYQQRERILNIVDYISNYQLLARVISPVQAVLQIRANHLGQTEAVSLTNATVGTQKNIRILIRRPKVENFTLMGQYVKTCKLSYEKTNDEYFVCVPTIPAYSVVTIFCEN